MSHIYARLPTLIPELRVPDSYTDNSAMTYICYEGVALIVKSNHRYRSKSKKAQPPQSKISSSNKKNAVNFNDYSVHDLLKGKHLEIAAAALLLSGKLKVDSVQLFRDSTVVGVYLLGQFRSGNNKDKSNALADFLEENGDMTLDDIVEAFQKRMKRKGR